MRIARKLVVGLLVLNLAGCWSRRELTEVSFVGLMGIDWVDNQYQVSLSINAPRRQTGEQFGTAARNVWTVAEQAPAIDAAMAKLDQTLQRSITLSHVRSIVFGEEMARRGIGPTMDFLLRSVEIRPTAWVAVTNGLAADLLGVRPRQDVPTEGPLGYQDAAQRRNSITPAYPLAKVANIMQEEGIDLALPLFRRGNKDAPNAEEAEDEGSLGGSEDNAEEVIYGGGGAFRDDQLVAWLTPHEVRGYLWGTGRLVHGAVSAECTTPKPNHRVVFRMRKGHGEVQVQVVGNKVKGRVLAYVVVDVNEINCEETLLVDGDVSRLEALLSKRVGENIHDALQRAHQQGADIFGFGRTLFRQAPAQFARLEKDWHDIVREMPVQVEVTAQVVRLGQLNRRYRWRHERQD